MRVKEILSRPFCLPLRRPWRSAAGTLAMRRGWLVGIGTDAGFTGWGEYAPESREGPDAGPDPRVWGERMRGMNLEDALDWAEGEAGMPTAAHCALEGALVDALARGEGMPMARWLSPGAPLYAEVNAALGALDDGIDVRLGEALRQGYRIFKCKLGVQSWEAERAKLRELARGLPRGARLRLDANRAWDEDQAGEALASLRGLPVESVEEPLRDGVFKGLGALQARVDYPLALDESMQEHDFAEVLRSCPVRRLILKPMRIGGPRRVLAMAQGACAAGLECVITTTVDAAIGTHTAAHLAAALNNGLAHGLATSPWLARDVAVPPRIDQGRVELQGPGLGAGSGRAVSCKEERA